MLDTPEAEEEKDLEIDWSGNSIPEEFQEEFLAVAGEKSLAEIRAAHEAYNKSDKSAEKYKDLQSAIYKNSYKLDKVSLKEAEQGSSVPVRNSEGAEVGRLKMVDPGYKSKNAVPSLTPDELKGFEEISITRAGLNRNGDIANPRVTLNAIYKEGRCTHFELPPAEYGISLVDKEGKEIPEFTSWKVIEGNEKKSATEFVKEKAEAGADISEMVVCCTKYPQGVGFADHPQGVVSLCTAQELSSNMRSMGKWQEVGHSASVGHGISAEEAQKQQPTHAMSAEEEVLLQRGIPPMKPVIEKEVVKEVPLEQTEPLIKPEEISLPEKEALPTAKELSMTNRSQVKSCIITFEEMAKKSLGGSGQAPKISQGKEATQAASRM